MSDSNGTLPHNISTHSQSEIEISKFINTAKKHKLIIFLTVLAPVLLAVIFVSASPKYFRSQVSLIPALPESNNVGVNLGGVENLIKIAGLNFGGSRIDNATLALEMLKSRKFISEFVQKNEYLIPLLASDGWDDDSGKWIIDKTIYDSERGNWVNSKNEIAERPSDLKVYNVFSKRLSVEKTRGSELIIISFESESPYAAKYILENLVKDLNKMIKNDDVKRAQTSIKFIKKQLDNTNLIEMRNIFYQLIEQQTKTIMLANAQSDYALRVLDPPYLPEQIRTKQSKIIIISSLIFGLIFSILIVMTITVRAIN